MCQALVVVTQAIIIFFSSTEMVVTPMLSGITGLDGLGAGVSGSCNGNGAKAEDGC